MLIQVSIVFFILGHAKCRRMENLESWLEFTSDGHLLKLEVYFLSNYPNDMEG